jgi:hypothetical protein
MSDDVTNFSLLSGLPISLMPFCKDMIILIWISLFSALSMVTHVVLGLAITMQGLHPQPHPSLGK